MSRAAGVDKNDPRSVIWRVAAEKAGGWSVLGRRYGVTAAAVQQWRMTPPERVLDIERLTGINRYELRPDVFGEYPTDVAGSRQWDITTDKALAEFGKRKLAEALDVPESEIDGWDVVPATLVLQVERATGISRHQLRPDVFGEYPEPPSKKRSGSTTVAA